LLVVLQTAIIGEFVPPLAVFAAVAVIAAGIVAIGWRWAPILGTLICGLVVAMNAQPLMFGLVHPNDFRTFAFDVSALAVAVIGILAGISATVQNYRRAPQERRAPRGLAAALIGVTGLVAGAILVASIPQQASAASITPEVMATLPALGTKDFMFTQHELHAKVGETIAYRLENSDGEAHYFEIDELNVHAPIPAGKTGVAMFKALKPGTYTFYCGPHSDRATMEGMVGKLIVTQ
jgi:plastocyanin